MPPGPTAPSAQDVAQTQPLHPPPDPNPCPLSPLPLFPRPSLSPCSFFQVAGWRIFRTNFQFGAGILSCMGVSFTTVPIATSVINQLMKEEGHTFEAAYGMFLGTIAVCGVIPVVLSFFPIRVIKNIFPPIVCGITIIMIGVHLIAAGFKVGVRFHVCGWDVGCAKVREHMHGVHLIAVGFEVGAFYHLWAGVAESLPRSLRVWGYA